MTTDKNLREELLRQNGASTQQKTEDFRNRILAVDQVRVSRMRRLVIVAWTAVAASLMAGAVVRLLFPDIVEFKPQLVPLFITVFQGLLLIAAIFTISWYIRSRTLTMHQVQTSLALIEEHLRKMANKD